MNFFTAGFVLACLQLDLGWGIGYVIKLAGGLFMLGGIAEMNAVDDGAAKYKPLVLLMIPACAGSAAAMFALAGEKNDLTKVLGIVCGAVTTFLACLFFRKLFALLKEKPFIAGNAPETERLAVRYERMLAFTAVALIADGVNRFTGGTEAADATGLIAFFTKLIVLAFLISCTLSVNKLRVSYNSVHAPE
ncbi:MAG: hypothetical protein IKN17_00510 [Ruminococcus sp.]|nr:hypothetical protein [Ruminococcus sp.]